MLTISSRYTTDIAADGTVIGVKKPVSPVKYSIYTVKDGDTMDLLATRLYGDPTQWWRIADMNPHITFPDIIRVGDVLRLPE